MSFTFRPAKREHIPLIIGIAGPTKSGKTYSAHRVAKGLAGDKKVVMLNAEGARGHQYADKFSYETADLKPPYRPMLYTEAIEAVVKLQPGALIIDSCSHMHDGPGGMLDWHEQELDRMAGQDQAKRQKCTFAAWVKPKQAENEFIYALLACDFPIIICLRAKEKIKLHGGKVLDLGWQPIVSDRVAFETMFTVMLLPHSKGVPDLGVSDMREPFDAMVSDKRALDEDLGRKLAEWSRGADAAVARQQAAMASPKPAAKSDGTPRGDRLTALHARMRGLALKGSRVVEILHRYTGVETLSDLSDEQLAEVEGYSDGQLRGEEPTPPPEG